MLVFAAGSIFFMVPHYFSKQYSSGSPSRNSSDIDGTCLHSINEEDCTEKLKKFSSKHYELSDYKWLMFIGQLLHGVGGGGIVVLGNVLLAETVKESIAPIYLAVYQVQISY